MELHHAKRSMFQTALAPIVYKRTQRPPSDDAVPDRADPGQPAIERAAIPRAVAWTDDELTEAERRLQAPAHRAILVALRSSDPTALISAVSVHDNKDSKVVSEVVSTLARVRSQNIRNGLDDITHHVDRIEKQLAERLSDDVVRVFEAGDDAEQSRLDRIAAAITRMSPGDANNFMREMADATTDDVDRRLDKVERASASGQLPQPLRRSGPGPSIEALRNHVRERILAQDFGSSRTLGQKVNRLILAAKSFDIDLTPVQMSAKKLGFTNGDLLESAADVWKDWLDDLTHAADAAVPTQPFGYLHLERLDFVPAGVEHGELIYSIPLAPAEEVAIVHKEWSNTNEEFHKIVSDQFEDYSEKGVVEHTELGSSSQSQAQHASSFSLSMSASGGYGPISANVNTSYSTQQSDSQSRETSIRQTSETTKKASARSRKAHKISFRLAKKTGIEDQTVRRIKNPDPIHPVRYDYYQLLRKWRVDLRRYGIRLTYDLTIPEPAIDLLGAYQEIAELENKIEKGFAFDLEPEAVTRDNWVYLANFYGAKIDPPPRLMTAVQGFKVGGPWPPGEAHVDVFTVKPPDGYTYYDHWDPMVLRCVIATDSPDVFQNGFTEVYWHSGNPSDSEIGFLVLQSKTIEQLVSVRVWFSLKDEGYRAWQVGAYEALREASARTYMDNRQIMQERRARLLAEVNQGDALTLRKVEREELMKNVIRWLFGPGFHFSPPGVPSNFYGSGGAVVNQGTAAKVLSHGRLISFLHQALEWENLNSFLYPYFWTPRPRWTDRLRIRHEDPLHEAFLRAGAARVVLPIRPGWENAFLSLLSTGKIDSVSHPYQTIAEEIENYARTNYPGIPSANDPSEIDPEANSEINEGKLITSWYEYTPTSAVDIKVGETAPTEGEFQQPAFAPPIPDKAWWLDPQVGQAVAAVLAALADKLDDTD